jgi:hypothetical protein
LAETEKIYKAKNNGDLYRVTYNDQFIQVVRINCNGDPFGDELFQIQGVGNVFKIVVLENGSKYFIHVQPTETKFGITGYGIHIGETGYKYEGLYLNGKPEGKGKEVLPDGSVYEGNFKNGKKDGYGVYTFGADTEHAGDKYEGEWKEGKMDGEGVYTFAGGEKLEGKFENNEFVGEIDK